MDIVAVAGNRKRVAPFREKRFTIDTQEKSLLFILVSPNRPIEHWTSSPLTPNEFKKILFPPQIRSDTSLTSFSGYRPIGTVRSGTFSVADDLSHMAETVNWSRLHRVGGNRKNGRDCARGRVSLGYLGSCERPSLQL